MHQTTGAIMRGGYASMAQFGAQRVGIVVPGIEALAGDTVDIAQQLLGVGSVPDRNCARERSRGEQQEEEDDQALHLLALGRKPVAAYWGLCVAALSVLPGKPGSRTDAHLRMMLLDPGQDKLGKAPAG